MDTVPPPSGSTAKLRNGPPAGPVQDARDEASRLRALRALDLLDTPPDEAFDAIVLQASEACGTPMALVSLVDADRQWFKARVGMEATQTPRNVAICHYAIQDDEAFVVSDLSEDERFASNPLVANAPSLRFYAGMPLRTPDGHRIGTLCVLDRRPRELSDAQRGSLEGLRHAAEILIARRTKT